MGSVVSALTGGVSGNSGAAGINYRADQANLMQPVTQGQINSSISNVGDQQAQQQALLQALQAQQGIQNQSSIFNQMQGVANGTGPNPAQAQLAQATSANVANQASLMAGQRGSSQNVGLIARQAAQQGAATQQQSAGQAATLQAQQSLNALQNLGGIANQQVAQQMGQQAANANYAQAQQGQLLNAAASYNQAQTGSQSSVNQANAGIANTVAGGQLGIISGITGGAGSALGLGAQGGKVSDLPRKAYADPTGPVSESDNSPVFDNSQPQTAAATPPPQAPPAPQSPSKQTAAAGPKSKVGQTFQAQSQPGNSFSAGNTIGTNIGSGVGAGFKALGNWMTSSSPTTSAGLSGDAATLHDIGSNPTGNAAEASSYKTYDSSDPGDLQGEGNSESDSGVGGGQPAQAFAHGGKVPALLSPGERYLPPKDVKKAEKGENPMKLGKKVPGKPKVSGAKNSYANDTVKATLDEGGIVLPRSITQHKHPHWAAKQFVEAIMAKHGGKLPK